MTREGKRIRTEHLELRASASLSRHPRVGFIVPKYGQSSVDRNYLKRCLREATRCQLLQVLPAVDVVVRARKAAYAVSYQVLAAELASAVKQIAMITRNE